METTVEVRKCGRKRKEQGIAALATRYTISDFTDLPISATTEEAARILGKSQNEIRAAANRGELPGMKIGGSWRFSTRRMLAMLDGEVA